VHADPRLVLAPHPTKNRFDAIWIVGGRVADWGPLPPVREIQARTASALAASAGPSGSSVPAAEVDEVRIVSAWMAEHEPPALTFAEGAPAGGQVSRFLRESGPGSDPHAGCVSGAAA
jgi:hypothetical protein